mgnify:CR=1 FL=1
MSLPVRDQLRYWGIAAIVFAVVLWFLGNVLMPFIIGAAVAYFIDPVADRLERAGLSRVGATAVITIAAVLIFVLMMLLVVPTLISQTAGLIETLPKLTNNLQTFLGEHFPSLLDADSTMRQTLASIGEAIKSRGPQVVETLLGSPAKAKKKLGWEPQITAQEMCAEMVANDLKVARRHALLKEHGLDLPISLENG